MLAKLVKENPNCAIVDSGNLTNTSDNLELIAGLMSVWKYDAVGVGSADLNIPNFFQRLADCKLTVLCAAPDAPAGTIKHLLKNAGGLRVGVVSFGGARLNPAGGDLAVRRSLYSALKTARESCDVLVLLDQASIATPNWLTRMGPRLGWPDVVISGVNNSRLREPEVVGSTWIMPTANQARSVGVVDIELGSNGERKLASQMVVLDESIPNDEAVAKQVTDLLAQVKASAAAATPYYPAEQCKPCHLAQYEHWQQTGHSRAYHKLEDEDRNDARCLNCHSEVYRRKGTVMAVKADPSSVECGTCHYASLPHRMERKNTSVRIKVDPKLCLECHTQGQSPNYDEKSYLAKISHESKPPASSP